MARSLKIHFTRHYRINLDRVAASIPPAGRSMQVEGGWTRGPRLLLGNGISRGALDMLGVRRTAGRRPPGGMPVPLVVISFKAGSGTYCTSVSRVARDLAVSTPAAGLRGLNLKRGTVVA